MAEQDNCFHLPPSAVKKQPGYAFDIGGSLAKLVYIDNTSKREDVVTVRSKVFKKTELSGMIQFIKNNCPSGGKIELESTGFNSFVNKQLLEKELNISLKIADELKCYSRAVVYCVKNYLLEDVFYPQHPEVVKGAQKLTESWAESVFGEMGDVSKEETPKDQPAMSLSKHHILDYKDDKKHFPCLVVMLGSGIAFYMVTEDGKYQFLDVSHNGGCTFLAMCHFLLGTRDFDKIMEMAENGDNTNVDLMGKDAKKEFRVKEGEQVDEAKLYLTFPDNQVNKYGILLYLNGMYLKEKIQRPLNTGPFRKEDLAQSYWYNAASQMVQTAVLVAKCHNFKRIFITGGIARHEYARRILETHVLTRLRMYDQNVEEKTLYGFLKNCESFGALGAILKM